MQAAGGATVIRDTARSSESADSSKRQQQDRAGTEKTSVRPRSWTRLVVASVSLVIAMLATAAVLYRPLHPRGLPGDPSPPSPHAANSVAVMQFENQRGDDPKNDWYRKALQTAFNTELSKIPQLSVVAPEIIQRAASEQAVDQMAAAQRLGVSRFVTGSFAVLGNTIRIDAHIVETSKGLQEAAENVEGNQDQFFALQKQLALATLGHFRVQLTDAQEASLKQTNNARPDKYRMLLQAEGVTKSDAPAVAPKPPEPQARRPDGPESLIASFLCSSAYAQVVVADAEAAARDLLEQYRIAQEEGNLDLLASLYVSFSDGQRRSVHAYLENVQSLRVKLADVKIQPREHDVAVSYTRHDEFIDKDTGLPVSLDVRVTKFLVQDGGKWKFAAES